MRTYIPKKLKGTIKTGTTPKLSRDGHNGGYNWSNDPFSDPFERLGKGKLTKNREYNKNKYYSEKELIKVEGKYVAKTKSIVSSNKRHKIMNESSNRTAEAVELLKKHSMTVNDGREFDYSASWILGAMHDFAFPLEEMIIKLESEKESYFNDAKRYSDKLEAAKTLIKQQHESNQESQSTINQLREERDKAVDLVDTFKKAIVTSDDWVMNLAWEGEPTERMKLTNQIQELREEVEFWKRHHALAVGGNVELREENERLKYRAEKAEASSEQYKENWTSAVSRAFELQQYNKELVIALEHASRCMTKARKILTEREGQQDCWQMLNAENIESILSKANLKSKT
jgi:hypothetical protein